MSTEIKIDDLISTLRGLEIDHEPEGWPAVQMKEITALCDAVEGAIPSLDLLEAHLEKGAYIAKQEDKWYLFTKGGDGIVSGETIRNMLMNLIFLEC